MKRRPACVVSADAYQRGPDVIVAMVTSHTGRRQTPGLGDVVVTDWQAAGLRAPSTVRTGRLLVLEQRLLGTTLGRLTQATLADVDAALRAVLGLP
jgi:mRNA-degrading endonuclease toxin of MazEF toxin-antitoxin module